MVKVQASNLYFYGYEGEKIFIIVVVDVVVVDVVDGNSEVHRLNLNLVITNLSQEIYLISNCIYSLFSHQGIWKRQILAFPHVVFLCNMLTMTNELLLH